MVKPAGAKYDVAEMGLMVGKRLEKMDVCKIHRAELPCRHCNPKRDSKTKSKEDPDRGEMQAIFHQEMDKVKKLEKELQSEIKKAKSKKAD